jgi:hypothetical protein
MSILKDIFTKSAATIVDSAGKIVDEVVSSDEEKQKLKNELSKIVLDNLKDLSNARKDVLITELQGNWLQRSWRPIVMMTFAGVVLIAAFYPVELHAVPEKFWTLLTVGLGGYVAGRSLEKISNNVTKNADITFLKKKDRKVDN